MMRRRRRTSIVTS
uniref:Uncharacterized protein n=1 Tax=Arundo donax TaxID=35708 RepID=A0A0A8YGG7_ARUDO